MANDPESARWVVYLRCYLLSLLRIHSPDCERCNAHETRGLRRRSGWKRLTGRHSSECYSTKDVSDDPQAYLQRSRFLWHRPFHRCSEHTDLHVSSGPNDELRSAVCSAKQSFSSA